MGLTCSQREHLHVLELQRGVGRVQSLAVVCHVHVCLSSTDPQLPDSRAERLVQEDDAPPLHLPLVLTPPHTYNNPPPPHTTPHFFF